MKALPKYAREILGIQAPTPKFKITNSSEILQLAEELGKLIAKYNKRNSKTRKEEIIRKLNKIRLAAQNKKIEVGKCDSPNI